MGGLLGGFPLPFPCWLIRHGLVLVAGGWDPLALAPNSVLALELRLPDSVGVGPLGLSLMGSERNCLN